MRHMKRICIKFCALTSDSSDPEEEFGHSSSPEIALLQVRVRLLVPPPQVTEHEPN